MEEKKVLGSRDRNKILILLFIGVFMGALDIGIVGPALPSMQSFFDINTRLASWIFTIYILFFMIGTPLMAKLSDMYGRRPIYILDVGLFAIGSAITAFSVSFEMMLLGRAIQGFGAGGIFPVASAFIGDTFPPEKRGGALGIIGSVFGLSVVIGPILGGLLLKYGWQWLFIINLPIALLVIILSLIILPVTKRRKVSNFDWRGTVVLGILVTSLAYGLNQIETNNFLGSIVSLNVWPFLLLSIILLPVLWKIEKKANDPVIQVDLFSNKEVRLATGISIGTGLSQSAIVFIPSFAVLALSLSITDASFMLIPLVLTMTIFAPVIGLLLDRLGSKIVIVVGSFLLIAGMIMISLLASNLYLFIISEVIMGMGLITILGSPLRYIMLLESPAKERASGQALININSSIGQLIGGAFIGTVIASQAGLSGFETAYLLIALVGVVILGLSIGLKSRKEQLKIMESSFKS
ncbi:MAG TPA: MFS transporter [Methanobacteriaceae archaeon]|nr:MFS transporter [Methanobacteriaceae archaeon]